MELDALGSNIQWQLLISQDWETLPHNDYNHLKSVTFSEIFDHNCWVLNKVLLLE